MGGAAWQPLGRIASWGSFVPPLRAHRWTTPAPVRGSVSLVLARTRNLQTYKVDSSAVNALCTVKSWRYLLKYSRRAVLEAFTTAFAAPSPGEMLHHLHGHELMKWPHRLRFIGRLRIYRSRLREFQLNGRVALCAVD